MSIQQTWFALSTPDEIDSPALLVFPERVRSNIAAAISMAGGAGNLRPHIKTHKSPEVTRLMLAAGITKFKCATIAEAEMLAMEAAPDVLLAYQPTGPKLARFVHLVTKYPSTKFSCLTDNIQVAEAQSAAFADSGLRVGVYVDLNVGMNRTGIAPGTAALELFRHCTRLSGIDIKGLHAYDGHIRNSDINLRSLACDAAFEPVLRMKEMIVNEGFKLPTIIAGGSHTFPLHCKRSEVECSPGTFVYWDKGNSDYCPEQPFEVAAVLMTRIVSLPAPGIICTDLGHKSVAAENAINQRVSFLNAADVVPLSQSEEHLVAQVPGNHSYQAGDVLYGIPYHVCPTVALYESVYTVENGSVTGKWRTVARDRFLTI